MDWLSGLLGAAEGGGGAVERQSIEQLRAIAEEAKRNAEVSMMERMKQFEHGLQMQRDEAGYAQQSREGGLNRAARVVEAEKNLKAMQEERAMARDASYREKMDLLGRRAELEPNEYQAVTTDKDVLMVNRANPEDRTRVGDPPPKPAPTEKMPDSKTQETMRNKAKEVVRIAESRNKGFWDKVKDNFGDFSGKNFKPTDRMSAEDFVYAAQIRAWQAGTSIDVESLVNSLEKEYGPKQQELKQDTQNTEDKGRTPSGISWKPFVDGAKPPDNGVLPKTGGGGGF